VAELDITASETNDPALDPRATAGWAGKLDPSIVMVGLAVSKPATDAFEIESSFAAWLWARTTGCETKAIAMRARPERSGCVVAVFMSYKWCTGSRAIGVTANLPGGDFRGEAEI
jgi:hypothetical protein